MVTGKPLGEAIGALFIFILAVSVTPLLAPCHAMADAAKEPEWVAQTVSVQGEVMVRRKDTPQWQPVQLGDRFLAGDMVKVEANSRAAFVLKNESTLRVDQKTTLVFSQAKPRQSLLIELIHGAIHFFSRVNRSLDLVTPFVNGTIEGTEFVARVGDQQTTISLLEGRLQVFNAQGSVQLAKNQTVLATADQPPRPTVMVRPRDAVKWTLYYPTVIDFKPSDFGCNDNWCAAARQSVVAWRRGNLSEAFTALAAVPTGVDDSRFLLYRATLQLSVGRVVEATRDLESIPSADVRRREATALFAIIALVQNDKKAAQQLIDQARSPPLTSAGVDLAQSYVQQAFFNLAAARDSVRAAIQTEPYNSLAWARLSELELSLGNRKQALSAAQRAADLQPQLARTLNVLGFAYLAQIKTRAAKQAFEQAITLDSADPLARLGLGLAKIRQGHLADGRGEIEIAASLDPGNALIRSYLGKAYYEEKRDDPARVQLAAAKELDPADPTPWYYDAIRKQTLNRPVEALHDLQQSIQLNDNRAVFRSRLLLDEDLAARSASIGRVYRDLGFEQLALIEGWKSVNTDPSNYSAHRFLADSYSVLPRHEIARVSELLQSQMLQPININPVQPSLAESSQFILAGTEPSAPAFNEFGPLFQRNRLALQASGVVGNNSTWGDEITLSGLYNRYSLSLGQFHYQTEGFRENNDQKSNLYNVFGQISISPEASILAEYRSADEEKGDLDLRFDPENFFKYQRTDSDQRTFRVGGRYSSNPHNDILGTVIFSDLEGNVKNRIPEVFFSFAFPEEEEALNAELQHLFKSENFNFISGIGYFHSEYDRKNIVNDVVTSVTSTRLDHTTPYVYSTIHMPATVIWTVGASVDLYDSQTDAIDRDQFNPKLGVTWKLTPATTLRAAAFRTFKRSLIANQTLEPTQVAGFNQFFDDFNSTDAWRYGGAIDQVLGRNLFAGIEYSQRDLEFKYLHLMSQTYKTAGWDEEVGRAYVFWTPYDWLSGSIEYSYSRFEKDPASVTTNTFTTLKTHRFPIGANLFHPSGIFLRLKATYVNQEGEFGNPLFDDVATDSDHFWVLDGAIGFRLPKRYGIVSLEGKNLFDNSFRFEDIDPSNPEVVPERVVLAKITLAF